MEHEYLDKMEDFEYKGKPSASRLGYRINAKFVRIFFGRVFNNPDSVLTEIKPELQDMDTFVEGMETVLAAHRSRASMTVQLSRLPAAAILLHIMAHGDYEGKSLEDPELRGMFSRSHAYQ